MKEYFDSSYLWGAFPQLLPFLKITFIVAASAVVLGLLLGTVLAMMKLSTSRIARKIANGYTTVLRCTPSIVLLFLVYYGIPYIGARAGLDLNQIDTIIFVIIAFSLQFGAIMSEVIRSAYLAIDKGQFEAGVSVGMRPYQVMLRIVLPQALVVALPNFGNGLISLLHEGAIAYTISLLTSLAKQN